MLELINLLQKVLALSKAKRAPYSLPTQKQQKENYAYMRQHEENYA